MLHIIQVVVSGFAEIPTIHADEAKAQAAYVEGAKKYWSQSYAAYCEQNGLGEDSLSSAQAFLKSFDPDDRSKINHWVVKPEEIGLDRANLLALIGGSLAERRRQIQALSQEVERKSDSVKKEMAGLLGKLQELVSNVNALDMPVTGAEPVGAADPDLEPLATAPDEPEAAQGKYQTPEWLQFVGYLKNLCGGSWSEFPLYTKQDWRQEVYGNQTSFEYWDWAAAKIDDAVEKAKDAGYSVREDRDQRGVFRFETPDGAESEGNFRSEIEAWCHASFHEERTRRPQK